MNKKRKKAIMTVGSVVVIFGVIGYTIHRINTLETVVVALIKNVNGL